MKRVITTALLAGALAVSGTACSEDTEHSWKQAGDTTESALEHTGEDLRQGTSRAMHEGGEVLERGGDELRDQDHDVASDDGSDDATHG